MFRAFLNFCRSVSDAGYEPAFLLEETRVEFRRQRDEKFGEARARQAELETRALGKQRQSYSLPAARTAAAQELQRRERETLSSEAERLRQEGRSHIKKAREECAQIERDLAHVETDKIAEHGFIVHRCMCCDWSENRVNERRLVRWTDGRLFVVVLEHALVDKRYWSELGFKGDWRSLDLTIKENIIPQQIHRCTRSIKLIQDVRDFTEHELHAATQAAS